MLTSHWPNGLSFHLLLLFSPHNPDTKVIREDPPLKEKWISLSNTISKVESLNMPYQWGPSGRVIFLLTREASSVETKFNLEGCADAIVCPSQRARALGLKRSGWAIPWKEAAPMVKAPSSRACRERESGTTAVPLTMPRATTNAGLPLMPMERCHPLRGAQTPEATWVSSPDAPAVNRRIRGTPSPLWRPPVPPTVSTVEAAIAPPLRPSRGAKAAEVQPRGGEASLRRKAGPDGTSMAPLTQGMGETWCVFSVYYDFLIFIYFFVCPHFCLAFFSYANLCIVCLICRFTEKS